MNASAHRLLGVLAALLAFACLKELPENFQESAAVSSDGGLAGAAKAADTGIGANAPETDAGTRAGAGGGGGKPGAGSSDGSSEPAPTAADASSETHACGAGGNQLLFRFGATGQEHLAWQSWDPNQEGFQASTRLETSVSQCGGGALAALLLPGGCGALIHQYSTPATWPEKATLRAWVGFSERFTGTAQVFLRASSKTGPGVAGCENSWRDRWRTVDADWLPGTFRSVDLILQTSDEVSRTDKNWCYDSVDAQNVKYIEIGVSTNPDSAMGKTDPLICETDGGTQSVTLYVNRIELLTEPNPAPECLDCR